MEARASTRSAWRGWLATLYEGRWWALVGAVVAAAAIYVGVGLFVRGALTLALAIGAAQFLAWLWGRTGDGEHAPPLAQSSWTQGGIVVACVALITGAAAVNSGLNLLYLMFGAMIGSMVVSGIISTRAIRGLVLEREVPARAFAGKPFDLLVTVANSKRVAPSIALTLRESLSTGTHSASAREFVPMVGPKQVETVQLSFTLPHRGLYRFDRHHVSSLFPFGFFRKSLSWGRRQELVVYPAVGATQLTARSTGREPHWVMLRHSGARHGNEEFHGLREYRPGDNPKWIHWRTSARIAKHMVREMESRDTIHLTILLDTHVPEGDAAAAHRLEVAVSLAATLACEHARAKRRVALVAFAPNLVVVEPTGLASPLDEMLRTLALVEPVDHPVASMLAGEARRQRLVGGETLLLSLDGGGLRTDMGDGVTAINVGHGHLASLFDCPVPNPDAAEEGGQLQ